MKTLAKVIRIVGIALIAIAGVIILVGHIGVITSQGFSAYLEMMSPYNVLNYLVTILTLAPGFGVYQIGKWLEGKAAQNKLGT